MLDGKNGEKLLTLCDINYTRNQPHALVSCMFNIVQYGA